MTGFEVLGLVLLVLAFLFIGVECVVPGIGAPGILGGLSLIAGVALCADTLEKALILTAILAVLMLIFIFTVLRLLGSGKIKSPIVLQEKLDKENGFISSDDLNYMIGKTGVAVTGLRPAGKISVDDLVLDVISEGPFIEKGQKVQILRVSNSSLVVGRVPESDRQ